MEKYKYFFDHFNAAAILSDFNTGKILEINKLASLLLDKSQKDLTNLKRTDILPVKTIDEINAFLKKSDTCTSESFILSKKNKTPVVIESFLIKEDKKKFLLELLNGAKPGENISMKSLIKNLPGVAYRCRNDKNWTMEFVSEGSHSLTGYKPDDFINNKKVSYSDIIHKDDKDMVWNAIQKSLEENKPFQIVYRIITADKKEKWVWEQGQGIVSDNNFTVEGFITDITEQKRIENELQYSESKFRSLVEESLVGVYIIQNEKFVYVNPRFAEIFGYTINEITKMKIVEDLVYEPDREIVSQNIRKRLSGDVKTIHYTFRGVKKDKSLVDIEVMGSKTTFNNQPAVIGTLLDITERKQSDEQIRKLSRAVNQSPVSIVITDIYGNIEYINPKFCELTGYSFDEVKGKNPLILKSGDKMPDFYKKLWSTIKEGNEWTGEFLNKKKDGKLFWESASISPIKSSEGEITHFMAVKEDITERKQNEKELKAAKEKAEEMSRLKSIFLANMSHELRTPMVAILGYSEILRNEVKNNELKNMSSEIYESSKRLMSTLNLILDLSRIEAKKAVVNYEELNVSEIAVNEFKLFESLARKKNLLYRVKIPDIPIISFTDERLLRQIINNLASNAVKFTNEGGITLSVEKEILNGNNNVAIKVSDTGIGIPENSLNIIFEEFRQVSEGLNRIFDGVGLGLTITKRFIEMMGGKISVESKLGEGSTFTVKLPLRTTTDISQYKKSLSESPAELITENANQLNIEFPHKEKGLKKPSILLIEDDASNAGVIKFFLEDLYKLDIASTGEEGIEYTLKNMYDAILMDIDLKPGMTGLKAAQKIKEIPGYANKPIIAVTALAMKGDKEKFLAEGCTHYLAKPFKKEELIRLIEEALKE